MKTKLTSTTTRAAGALMPRQQVADEQFNLGDIPMEGNLQLSEEEFRVYARRHHRLESDNVLPNTIHYLLRNLLLLAYGLGRVVAFSRQRAGVPDSDIAPTKGVTAFRLLPSPMAPNGLDQPFEKDTQLDHRTETASWTDDHTSSPMTRPFDRAPISGPALEQQLSALREENEQLRQRLEAAFTIRTLRMISGTGMLAMAASLAAALDSATIVVHPVVAGIGLLGFSGFLLASFRRER